MKPVVTMETRCPKCGSLIDLNCLSMLVSADPSQNFKATITCKTCGYSESRYYSDFYCYNLEE